MIDKWFSEEVALATQTNKRLVITDNDGEGRFLLGYLPKGYAFFYVNSIDDEAFARFQAENEFPNDKVIFYSSIAAKDLTLLQEYVQTCGCINLDDIDSYLRNLLFSKLHKNTAISKEDLIIAAKMCKGKTVEWWKSIMDGLVKPLDIRENILALLHNPKALKKNSDKHIWKSLCTEIYTLIGKPNTNQPEDALSLEVSGTIFSRLADGTLDGELLDIYYQWIDSKSLSESLPKHLSAFNLPADVDVLRFHPDHCFEALDKKLFSLVSKRLEAGTNCDDIVQYIDKRVSSPRVADKKASWLRHLQVLLEYRSKGIDSVTDIQSFAQYYLANFAKVDTAMRKLYVSWLSNETILRPIQNYYENLNKVLLDKWFSFHRQYQQNQFLYLKTILTENRHCAVIVGDGLRLEIANTVAQKIRRSQFDCKIEEKTGFCDLPSVTEIGMSRLFGINSVKAQDRFNHLKSEFPDVEIKQLDKLSDADTAEKLILSFGDIDQVGEKKQLGGLKDIDAYEDYLADAISRLLAMGYGKVFVTTDHGFVITGILDESDKVTPPAGENTKTEERYVLSDSGLYGPDIIEKEGDFFAYRYAYFAKTDKPFKTKGAYGYAHGGLTPQECIIPQYCFSSSEQAYSIGVCIINKAELGSMSSNFYKVKLKASGDQGSLFSNQVTVKIQRFVGDAPVPGGPVLTLSAGESKEMEFELPRGGEEKIVIVDSDTKKQYDFCTVKKSDDRDLGGLL